MNILEVEDQIKGLPDQMLIQEASQPSGRLPQFLVVSELQRRNDMRKAAQKPPTRTVTENVVQEGIASLMPQPPMQAPMQPSPQGQMPMQAPMAQRPRTSPAQPMAMASGGVTKMQDGGMSPFGAGFQGQGVPNIIDMVFQREMAAAQAQREAAEAARQQAATSAEQMQEQARRDALSQALVGIGTGIARGDMAGGFAAGAESAQGRMKEARTEAMRASERAEQLALAREEAARTGELGAFTKGAELRLGMQQGQQKDLPPSLQELAEARRIMSDPNASEADKAWAAGVFGTAEGKQNHSLANFVNPDTGESTLGVFGDDGIPKVYDPETGSLGQVIPPNFVRTTRSVAGTPADFAAVYEKEDSQPPDLMSQIDQVFGPRPPEQVGVGPRLEAATGPLQQAVTRPLNYIATSLGLDPYDQEALDAKNFLDILARDLSRATATDEGTGKILSTIYKDAMKDVPTAMTTDADARSMLRQVAERLARVAEDQLAIATNEQFSEGAREKATMIYQSVNSNLQKLLRGVNPAAFAGPASSPVDVGGEITLSSGRKVRRVE
jgi:hypothetical protein